jgi:hypothetical protein
MADAFALFTSRYGRFFRSKTRDSAAVAGRYLRALAQAQDCTFASIASVVDNSCAPQFQHFISNSPWDHKPVLAQISQDADRRTRRDRIPLPHSAQGGRFVTRQKSRQVI